VKSAGGLAVATGGIAATIVHGSMYANQVHQERPFRQFQQEILKIYQRVNSTEHIKRRVEEPEIRMPEL
jgi:IMP dehydrogenase/GMP reductase